ncbi:MAG: pyridoxal-phosphate dependent enzyme [Candidatus Bathyarchaeota archaeon]|jgi:threonine synthase|nr:pyridoxal-phosphate dependent enzyme [Candidatus Bathyarchaeota archaeon A05DMB-3]MDH7606168.1 pyridoxal-phosphate dependent enzyme [Candidatus Bathyarchaeota archaeon]
MSYEITCTVCGKSAKNLLDYKCASCGNPLDVKIEKAFSKKEIRKKEYSVWRYAQFFPYVNAEEIVTLSEGWTPLVKFTGNVYFKLENLNPTGSFKDRGSTVLISALHKQIKAFGGFISEDSSGNAGASIAAYAARVGINAKIYVPEGVSGPKLNQIMFYGAEVVKVSGTRSHVTEEAQKQEKGKIYVGHILHPIFRDGIRSLAYEIAEQLNWKAPERVYLPVSAGTLLLGVINGFKHLAAWSAIAKMPKIVACQTIQVSPLYHRFKGLSYHPPEKITSIADALVSTNPPLLELMTKELKDAEGDAEIIKEDEILQAFKELVGKGFFVEPSSAVAYAAYQKQLQKGATAKKEKTVVVLTGNGLKTSIKPN